MEQSLHNILRSLALFSEAVKACGFEAAGSVSNNSRPCEFDSDDMASDYYGRTYRDAPQTVIKVSAHTPLTGVELLPQKLAKFFWERYPYDGQIRDAKPFLFKTCADCKISWPCIFKGDRNIRILLLDLVPIYKSSETELILAFPFYDNPVTVEDNSAFSVVHHRSTIVEVVSQRVSDPVWAYNVIKDFPRPKKMPLGKVYDINFKKPWLRLSQACVTESINWTLSRAIADIETVLKSINAKKLIADLVAKELANLD